MSDENPYRPSEHSVPSRKPPDKAKVFRTLALIHVVVVAITVAGLASGTLPAIYGAVVVFALGVAWIAILKFKTQP